MVYDSINNKEIISDISVPPSTHVCVTHTGVYDTIIVIVDDVVYDGSDSHHVEHPAVIVQVTFAALILVNTGYICK
jgi:hypothetical protein